jgi:hypothetical protein
MTRPLAFLIIVVVVDYYVVCCLTPNIIPYRGKRKKKNGCRMSSLGRADARNGDSSDYLPKKLRIFVHICL